MSRGAHENSRSPAEPVRPGAAAYSALRRIDVVVSDIDGCLSDERGGAFDLERLAWIASYNRAAIERRDRPIVTVCSGRPQPFAEAMCRAIANAGESAVPCIAENGVWMYDPASNVYQMDPAITSAHLDAVHEATGWVRSELLPRGVSIQPGKSASISLYHPDTAYLKSLEPMLREVFMSRGWPLRVSSTWYYINCDLAHVSKSTGIARLLARLGVPRERAAGFGDTTSDLAMLEHVGIFGCPSNAAEEVKTLAGFVAEGAEAVGVCAFLAHVCSDAGGV